MTSDARIKNVPSDIIHELMNRGFTLEQAWVWLYTSNIAFVGNTPMELILLKQYNKVRQEIAKIALS